jgi:uncharacterized damage-inducible protein DinB
MSETTPAGEDRPWPPTAGNELDTLLGFLDYQRATFAWKCSGLSDDQLRIALPPTSMTLGGMLKHLASAEDAWFTNVVSRQPMPEPWASHDTDADEDWSWTSAFEETGEDLRTLWSQRVTRSRLIVDKAVQEDGAAALDRGYPAWLGDVSLRWVIVHMIEEYARHNGHADLIRESIDGETGE